MEAPDPAFQPQMSNVRLWVRLNGTGVATYPGGVGAGAVGPAADGAVGADEELHPAASAAVSVRLHQAERLRGNSAMTSKTPAPAGPDRAALG